MTEAMDALLAYRHGDTKHLTQDHARLLYEQLRESAHLKDLLVRAAPAVERAWGLEPGGPRKSRALSTLNAIRKAVPTIDM